MLTLGAMIVGFMIGLLVGISNSPVVAAALPLLFSVGSGAGVAWGLSQQDSDAAASKRRLRIIGTQAIAFSLMMMAGLWLGVQVKYTPDLVWTTPQPPQVAYAGLPYSDPREILAYMTLDRQLIEHGMSLTDRQSLLRRLSETLRARGDSGGRLSEKDIAALEFVITKQPGASGPNPETPQVVPVAFEPPELRNPILDMVSPEKLDG